MRFLIFLLVVNFSHQISAVDYRNAKAVAFQVENNEQLRAAQELEGKNGYKFWSIAPNQVHSTVELIVLPEVFEEFQEVAAEKKIDFKILTDDVQSWFDEERPLRKRKDTWAFDQYNTMEEIYKYLEDTHNTYPLLTQLFNIGKSFHGRDLIAIKITRNESNPIIFIDANIHAREWIASAVAVWLINELLTTTDASVRSLIDKLTWIIIPVLNPDGYIHSYVDDRTWRKTRSTHSSLLCYGADPNRNFATHWMHVPGASQVPCTDTYAGTHPYSEPEVKALVDFYDTLYRDVKIYLAFHSAAQMLLYPWGTTPTYENITNLDDLNAIAKAAVTAIGAKHGKSYVYGSSYNTLSAASGTSKDHMYAHYGTKISYTFEFRVASGVRFVLPPEEIIPNAEEAFAGILAMIEKSSELGYF